jgi:hypothetical protein
LGGTCRPGYKKELPSSAPLARIGYFPESQDFDLVKTSSALFRRFGEKASEQIEAQQVELVISEDSDPAEKGGLRRTLV